MSVLIRRVRSNRMWSGVKSQMYSTSLLHKHQQYSLQVMWLLMKSLELQDVGADVSNIRYEQPPVVFDTEISIEHRFLQSCSPSCFQISTSWNSTSIPVFQHIPSYLSSYIWCRNYYHVIPTSILVVFVLFYFQVSGHDHVQQTQKPGLPHICQDLKSLLCLNSTSNWVSERLLCRGMFLTHTHTLREGGGWGGVNPLSLCFLPWHVNQSEQH